MENMFTFYLSKECNTLRNYIMQYNTLYIRIWYSHVPVLYQEYTACSIMCVSK